MILTLENIESSLISDIYWDDNSEELTIVFRKFYVPYFIYCGVSRKEYNSLISAKSVGSYYLSHIKNKLKMSDEAKKAKPKGVNKAKSDFRWFEGRIDVKKILKDHIFSGEKSDYMDIRIRLMPDGEVDNYENCGFIVQKLPKDVKGDILGNIRENEWNNSGAEASPGTELSGKVAAADDLPF